MTRLQILYLRRLHGLTEAQAHALATGAHGLGWRVSLLPAPEGRDGSDVLNGKVAA